MGGVPGTTGFRGGVAEVGDGDRWYGVILEVGEALPCGAVIDLFRVGEIGEGIVLIDGPIISEGA